MHPFADVVNDEYARPLPLYHQRGGMTALRTDEKHCICGLTKHSLTEYVVENDGRKFLVCPKAKFCPYVVSG